VLGDLNERNYEEKLKAENVIYIREKPVKLPVENFDILFSGRIDFETADGTGKCVHELKSVSSEYVRKNTIRYGKYKPENLAQCVAYMIRTETDIGKLVYTFYEDAKTANPVQQESRVFDITLDAKGTIFVDAKPTIYTVQDQIRFQFVAAQVLSEPQVYHRPFNWDSKWGSPCKFCDYKGICEKWDLGEVSSSIEFLEQCEQSIKKE